MNLKEKMKKYRKKEIRRRYKRVKKEIWYELKHTIDNVYHYNFKPQNKVVFLLLKKYFEKKGFKVVLDRGFFLISWENIR